MLGKSRQSYGGKLGGWYGDGYWIISKAIVISLSRYP